ncbi:hypothetical protein [Actinomadura coerulea]|uniref:hypothetical protein n=1 Tax=Actinomadura coerulea TaxID=46159 RepID=UPI003416861E
MPYWAYIAHLLGVADELVPRGAADGLRMAHHMILTAGGPTEWTDGPCAPLTTTTTWA